MPNENDALDELVEASNSPFTNRLEAAIYEYMRLTNSNHGYGGQDAYAEFAINCAKFIKEHVYVDIERKS